MILSEHKVVTVSGKCWHWRDFSYTKQKRYCNQEGGSAGVGLSHCTLAVLTPCEFSKCVNLDCKIYGSARLRFTLMSLLMINRCMAAGLKMT